MSEADTRTATTPAAGATVLAFRSDSKSDRLMRRALRITAPQRGTLLGAHRAFRWAIVLSGIRCLITYLVIPVLVPILSLSAWVAAPVGIVLCGVAVINGVISVRRFWAADHQHRWMYTAFIGIVFLILALAVTADILRLFRT